MELNSGTRLWGATIYGKSNRIDHDNLLHVITGFSKPGYEGKAGAHRRRSWQYKEVVPWSATTGQILCGRPVPEKIQ